MMPKRSLSFQKFYIAFIALTWVGLVIAYLLVQRVQSSVLDISTLSPESGFAFIVEIPVKGDSMSAPKRSNLVLLEDGKAVGPPHSLHADIRNVGRGAYSHWKKALIFSASDNSDPRTNHRVYSFSINRLFPGWLWVAAVVLSAPLFGILRQTIRGRIPRYAQSHAWDWGDAIASCAIAPAVIVVFGFVIFLGASIFFMLRGDTFFPATPLSTLASPAQIAEFDRIFPTYAILWAISCWGIINLLPFAGKIDICRKAETLLARLFSRWGLPVVVGLFLFRLGALWTAPGHVNTDGAALSGIVPFSDAFGHFFGVMSFPGSGEFEEWVLRRPLAAAFRLGLCMLSGYDPIRTVVVQTVLLATAAWVLAMTVLRRWGSFSAILCVIFVLIHARVYIATFLVEPLGLIFVCLSAAVLLEVHFTKSVPLAMIGLGTLTVALLVRMGAMFLVPAALVWIVYDLGKNRKSKILLTLIAGLTVGLCLGASFFISNVYGNSKNQLGGNFSLVLAGISIGGNWNDARQRYQEELAELDERDQANKLYQIAIDNMRRHPGVFLHRLWLGAQGFLTAFPTLMMQGFDGTANSQYFWILFGIALLRMIQSGQSLFWCLILLSIPASAAFVYFDEGLRVLCIAYPLVGIFLASALKSVKRFSTGLSVMAPSLSVTRGLAACLSGLLFALVVCAPALAMQFPPQEAIATKNEQPLSKQETVLWGAGTAAGVIVVGGDERPAGDEPSVRFEEFIRSIKNSGVERYQRLVTPVPPTPPFSFVANISPTRYHFIGPPELMRRRDVLAWRIVYRDWYDGAYWKEVTEATPLLIKAAP